MKNIKFYSLLIASFLSLSACAFNSNKLLEKNIHDVSKIETRDLLGFAYLISGDPNDKSTSYLMSISKDGHKEYYRLGQMDYGQVEWGESGIVFMDSNHDYRIDNDKLFIKRHKKVNYTSQMIDIGNGSYLAAYNDGEVEGRYDTPIIIHSETAHSEKVYDKFVDNLVRCKDNVFAFSNLPLEDSRVGEKSATLLSSIYRQGEFDFSSDIYFPGYLIGLSPAKGHAPCDEGKIYTISEYYNEADENPDGIVKDKAFIFPEGRDSLDYFDIDPNSLSILMIQSWDTLNGTTKNIILNDDKSNSITFDENRRRDIFVDRNSLIEGNLYWLAYDHLYKTNIHTGKTVPLGGRIFDGMRSNTDVQFAIIDKHAYVTYSPVMDGRPPHTFVIDLSDGRLVSEFRSGSNSDILRNYYVVDFAVNPDIQI